MSKYQKKSWNFLKKYKDVGDQVVDTDLLKRILQNQSPSMDDGLQTSFAYNILTELDEISDNYVYSFDQTGNMYVTKGSADVYPCVVAHLDTVHDYVKNYNILQCGDFVYAFDGNNGIQVGCGADDRVGVYIAIEMFRRFENIKLFFPVDEEIGCQGTEMADMEFFTDCAFLIQPDRNQYNDVRDYIMHTNGIDTTTIDFDEAVYDIVSKYGYIPSYGSFTDIGELLQQGAGCCAFNLSCYARAHTDQEVVYLPLLKAAMNLCYEVIDRISHRRWEIKVEKKSYSSYGGWGANYNSKNDYDYDDYAYKWSDQSVKYDVEDGVELEPVKDDSIFDDKDVIDTESALAEEIYNKINNCAYKCLGKSLENCIGGEIYCTKCGCTFSLPVIDEVYDD